MTIAAEWVFTDTITTITAYCIAVIALFSNLRVSNAVSAPNSRTVRTAGSRSATIEVITAPITLLACTYCAISAPGWEFTACCTRIAVDPILYARIALLSRIHAAITAESGGRIA